MSASHEEQRQTKRPRHLSSYQEHENVTTTADTTTRSMATSSSSTSSSLPQCPIRIHTDNHNDDDDGPSLIKLLTARQWEAATRRVQKHPEEVQSFTSSPSAIGGSNGVTTTTTTTSTTTPLALACRYGAPYICIKAILNANPTQIRHSLASRGTPLHEAMLCEELGIDVIDLLLHADETLDQTMKNNNQNRHRQTVKNILNKDTNKNETKSNHPDNDLCPYPTNDDDTIEHNTNDNNDDDHQHRVDQQFYNRSVVLVPDCRATLLQDVDGHTPLHLLLRRRFYQYRQHAPPPPPPPQQQQQQYHQHGNYHDEQHHFMSILRRLVQSCAEAVSIPDRGEFEEPPLVMALKRDIYSPYPLIDDDDDDDDNNNNIDHDDDNNDHGKNMVDRHHSHHHHHFNTRSTMERCIYEMVDCMLQHYPQAASLCLKGARGNYTALHSAVFHGRCPSTIALLLQAEAQQQQPNHHDTSRCCWAAPLLANTQGELPLHFCAMRGEPPRSIALLAEAAPLAVIFRDTSGLTPFHWLWVRFASTMLALMEEGNNNNNNQRTAPLAVLCSSRNSSSSSKCIVVNDDEDYDAFTQLERGDDFHYDLQLVRRFDPPVDFLRMRHIPNELLDEDVIDHLVDQTVHDLNHIRSRQLELIQKYYKEEPQQQKQKSPDSTSVIKKIRPVHLTRPEVVQSFFWTKVVSLLRAAASVAPTASVKSATTTTTYCEHDSPDHVNRLEPFNDDSSPKSFYLVHTAFASLCCPPAVAKLVGSLYSNEWHERDANGRLPLHCAAMRTWHAWDWPRGTNMLLTTTNSTAATTNHNQHQQQQQQHVIESPAIPMLQGETLSILEIALELSPPEAARVADVNNRLPLHYAIESLVRACCCCANPPGLYYHYHHQQQQQLDFFGIILDALQALVQMYPESLERRDGQSKLFPFLQASAVAAECHPPNDYSNSSNIFNNNNNQNNNQNSSHVDNNSSQMDDDTRFPVIHSMVTHPDEMPLSIVYVLLREHPSLIHQFVGSIE